MSCNELNAVEHFIIQKLSDRNLNAAEPMSSMVMEEPPVYGSFPWQYRSAAELNRPTDQVVRIVIPAHSALSLLTHSARV